MVDGSVAIVRLSESFLTRQLASSTLDASAKIYAGRVDAIHTEMYKVLSGLGRGASGSQKSPGELLDALES